MDSVLEKIKETNQNDISITEILAAFKAASCHLLNWNSFIDTSGTIHVQRSQVTDILNWIISPLKAKEEPQLLLVGDAGMGKTVVLKDVYENLIQLEIPVWDKIG